MVHQTFLMVKQILHIFLGEDLGSLPFGNSLLWYKWLIQIEGHI